MHSLSDLGPHGPLYLLAAGVFAVMILARRVPVLGRLLSFVMTAGAIVVVALLVIERAQFDPMFARVAQRFQIGGQQVVGKETRVPIAADGHFWVRVKLGGVERRMLIDSGATITAISADTAAAAGIDPSASLMPVVMQTANGNVAARTATVPVLRIGNVVARDELPVAPEIVAGRGWRAGAGAASSHESPSPRGRGASGRSRPRQDLNSAGLFTRCWPA